MIGRKDLLDKLSKAQEKRDLAGGMRFICAYVGAEHYLVARFDGVSSEDLGFVMTSDWPFDLVRSLGAAVVGAHLKENEVDRCLSACQPEFRSCGADAVLPGGISHRYCVIPFNAGPARLLLLLLFRDGIVLSQDRLQDAALLGAYHVGEFTESDVPAVRTFDLTEREVECLAWIAEGKTSDEIAVIIGISRNTINNYITSIMRKTSTRTRSEAIAFAVRNSII